MDDISLAAGSPLPVTIDGRKYSFARFGWGEFSDLHEHVKAAKSDELLAVIDRLPVHLQDTAAAKMIDCLANPTVSLERQTEDFLKTPRGQALVAAFSLGDQVKSPEEAGTLLRKLPPRFVFKLVNDVIGLADAKNSSAPPADSQAGQTGPAGKKDKNPPSPASGRA